MAHWRELCRFSLIVVLVVGTFAISFGANDTRQSVMFTSAEDRHFYGHGAFSPDGRLLYATENDYEGRRGVIGVRDATDGYRQIGEFSSGGIGPHDIAMLPGGRTLVVANGGIETHPDYGREILNLATMVPNLTYIDVETGDLLERHEFPKDLHRLSIRYLSVAEGDSVVFGCQHKGAKNEQPILIGFHRRGEQLRVAEIPDHANARLKGYVGSISTDRSGTIAAATSPRSGVALYLDVPGKRFLGINDFADASGIAARKTGPGFVLTSGTGRVVQARHDGLVSLSENAFAWDNHVTVIA